MVTATGCDVSCAAAKPGLQTATPANTNTVQAVRESRHAISASGTKENGLIR
jgi:hypothetical protein